MYISFADARIPAYTYHFEIPSEAKYRQEPSDESGIDVAELDIIKVSDPERRIVTAFVLGVAENFFTPIAIFGLETAGGSVILNAPAVVSAIKRSHAEAVMFAVAGRTNKLETAPEPPPPVIIGVH